MVENTLKFIKNKISEERLATLGGNDNVSATVAVVTSTTSDEVPNTTHPHIILPYKGIKGENIVKGLKKISSSSLPKMGFHVLFTKEKTRFFLPN